MQEKLYIIASVITIGTPLYFFIRWLLLKNYPLKFLIDTSSISRGGSKNNIPEGLSKINTSLRITVINRSSKRISLLIESINFRLKNELKDFRIKTNMSSANRSNILRKNGTYEIESKDNIILLLKIVVSPSSVCDMNKFKENIYENLNEIIYLAFNYRISTKDKKYHINLKVTNFFEELLKLIDTF